MIKIISAQSTMAQEVAELTMMAMDYDCCQYFAGPNHTLDDFKSVLMSLFKREDSQYSYLNTLVAVDDNDQVVGVCISYDGGKLKELRKAFLETALQLLEMDHSCIPDETQEGEWYIDTLAVREDFRHQGIATNLLKAAIKRAEQHDSKQVGLLVDFGNPKAEHLYKNVGFRYQNDNEWGGHPMKHFVYTI